MPVYIFDAISERALWAH